MRETMLILHFLGLAMGLGTSFAHAFLDKLISSLDKDEAVKFRLQIMVLSNMGYTGIVLLVVSGTYLIVPYWSTILSNPLLIVKLILVAVLIILLVLIQNGVRSARKSEPEKNLKKIELFGKMTFLVGIAIVIIAVNIFH